MKKQLPGWAVLLIITLVAGIALGATYALTKDPIAEQARIQAENARRAALPEADAFEELPLSEGAGVDWAYAGLKDGQPVGYVAQKTVNGFGGEVEVIAGVNTQDQSALTLGGISVGGSNFSETAGLGARSRDAAFTDQFIGKAVPVKYIKSGEEPGDNTVDALTSATITTTAVVNGVNDIVKYVKSDVLGIAGVEMPARPDDASVFSASAQGFRGPVYVEAAFEPSGEITYISVGDDAFAEDIGIGAKEPEFMIQFIGKTAPLTLDDVDALAGATITTNAVITALNDAHTLAGGGEIVKPEVETPALPEKPADGVYGASAQGFAGPVYVEAAFDGDAISYIAIGDDQFMETENLGANALKPEFQAQFIGKSMPLAVEDIDAITGATFTSAAVITALNDDYAQYQAANATATPIPTQTPAPTEAPVPTQAPEALPSTRHQGEACTGESIIFFDAVRVTASFDGDTVADLHVSTCPVGSDKEEPLEEEKAYQDQLIGKTMPLALTDIHTGREYMDQAVLTGLRLAYADAAPSQEDSGAFHTGEAVVFFTVVRAEAAFDGDTVAALKLSGKNVGDADFAPLPQEEAIRSALIGASVPLSAADAAVPGVPDYVSQAVAVAVNQAYADSNDGRVDPLTRKRSLIGVTPVLPDDMPSNQGGKGSCVVFNQIVSASCLFNGDRLSFYELYTSPVGSDGEQTPLDAGALYDALYASSLPLDAADYAAAALPDYLTQAIVIAVNQAYENAVAAQQ